MTQDKYFDLTVVIRPATNDRWDIEDDLEEMLSQRKLGQVVGTGAATDGSFCDVDIIVTNLEEGIRIFREILVRYRVPEETMINYHGPELVKYPVYV